MCEDCKAIVCQECTLWDHKEHNCLTVEYFAIAAPYKLKEALDSGEKGKQLIKASIDRAVTFSQAIERHAVEASQKIRKTMRAFMFAVEEREKCLLEKVEKLRQQKVTTLSDQMSGLRSALAGLASTSDMLSKAVEMSNQLNSMELAKTLTRGEHQMTQFAVMYKHLQPKEEFITYVSPSIDLLHEIRQQGEVKMVNQKCTLGGINLNSVHQMPISSPSSSCGNILTRRPIVRSTPQHHQSISSMSAWDPNAMLFNMQQNTSPNCLSSASTNIGQSIPGSMIHISVKPNMVASTSFAFDGHEDGQVSRPWGLCVDRDGNVIVADRRNNRVQVFYPNGIFKLKFGSKGSGNGQFDLPAGISTDALNRIVVVDKDNHRIQIFTAVGTFVLKYGSYGKDCGQFQYPWDVAVNSKGDMLVTDSRNHRIQMFNQDGHFISRFSFDGVNHSRSLKGLTTPRGVCYTPQGDIIVSDFENHRLLLIDAALTKVKFF